MDSPVAQPSRYNIKQCLLDVLLLVVLFGLTLKFSYDIAKVHDLGTDDETNYLAHGHFLSQWGLPSAEYSPLYVLWYNGWDQFHFDPTFVYFTNWKVLLYLLAAGMYVLVRALGGGRIGALTFAFLTLTSGVAEVWPFPMHLATFVLAIGAATAARLRSWPASLFIIGASFTVMSFLRPEFTYSLLLFCPVAVICAVWVGFKRRELRLRLLVAICLAAALIGVVFNKFGNPLHGGRSFLAFGQHYSLNVWAHHLTDVDPWTNWEAIIRADFGDATSVTQALRNNPRAVAWHVACNFATLPTQVNQITNSQLELGSRTRVVFRLALAAFVLVGALGFLRRLLRPSAAGEPLNSSLRIVLGMLLFIAPTGAAVVFIFPRQHYLIPLVFCGGALCFAGYAGFPRLRARLGWMERWPALLAFVALLIVVTPNQVHRWSVQQYLRAHWAPACRSLEVQRTVAVMRDLHIHSVGPVSILESDYSRAFYAGWDGKKIDHWTKTEGFWQFVAAHNISVVVLNERLLTDTRFRDDPAFQDFAAEKKIGHFRFFSVPETEVRLAVRADLLSARLMLAMAFVRDREFQTRVVTKDYQRYLGRAPRTGEVEYWVDFRQNVASDSPVIAGFLTAPEFYAQAGSTDKGWVNALYRTVLSRTADATEENHSLQQLANGVPKDQVALSILGSPERGRLLVERYYQDYLGRTAEPAEIDTGVNDIESGADEMVLPSIISSDEFYRRAGNTDQAWVEALYVNLCNRPATTEETSAWLRKLADGQ